MKLVNVPGTARFIPADDIVDIKIVASLITKTIPIFPESPDEEFRVVTSPFVSLDVISRYASDDEPNKDESSDSTSEDEDDDSKSNNDSDDDDDSENINTVTKNFGELQLLEQSDLIEVVVSESTPYEALSEKGRTLLEQRFEFYKKNLTLNQALAVLQEKLENAQAQEMEDDISSIVKGSTSEVEEEDDTVTKTPITSIFDPDEAKRKELTEQLDEDKEKQEKRIQYIQAKLGTTKVEIPPIDAVAFVTKLTKEHEIDREQLQRIEEAVTTAIQNVASLINY